MYRKSDGLICVVGYGYVLQLVLEWFQLIFNLFNFDDFSEHYDKDVDVGEYSKQLAHDLLRNIFYNETKNETKNTTPLIDDDG